MDEKETRISSILRRAKELAFDGNFASSEGDWFVNAGSQLNQILSTLNLEQLAEIDGSDDIIKSILEKLKEPPESPEPTYYSTYSSVPSLEDVHRAALIEGGFPISDEDETLADRGLKEARAKKENAIADYVSELIKDRRDRKRKKFY